MTALEIYEHGIKELSAMERLRLVRMIIDQLTESPQAQEELAAAWAEQIAQATIPNAELLRMAEKRQPPQTWWDEAEDPFSPEKASK